MTMYANPPVEPSSDVAIVTSVDAQDVFAAVARIGAASPDAGLVLSRKDYEEFRRRVGTHKEPGGLYNYFDNQTLWGTHTRNAIEQEDYPRGFLGVLLGLRVFTCAFHDAAEWDPQSSFVYGTATFN